MADPRSKRLAGPIDVAVGANGAVIYTCPAGKVALVKSVRMVNAAASAAIGRLRIGAAGAGTIVVQGSVPADGQFVDPDTDPIVLAAGEVLRASSQTNVVTFTISGAELNA